MQDTIRLKANSESLERLGAILTVLSLFTAASIWLLAIGSY